MNRLTGKHRLLNLGLLAGLCFLVISPAYGATYYVRRDGGTAAQCTGLADAPYPGSGTNQACAFSHPFWAIAPQGNNPTKMVGGDTLIMDGSNDAQYMIGFGGPNTGDKTKCTAGMAYDCYMRPVPSGPDPAHPTRILGKGWDTGCSSPPQLWATERAEMVINLRGSDNVEVQCLEITDHSDCQEHGPNPCNRTSSPYGKWGKTGFQAWDSENVLLKNINVHGMALKGIWAGRLKDWTIEDSRIYANSLVGWDGDVGAFNSSNSGTITFTRVILQYSGCGETYPGKKPSNCYSQSQGGYGDGLGTHQTGANWVFNNVDFSHNVSDGLDLLYHDGTGTVTIKRSRFEGNAGNQVKISANAVIENSIMVGNCNYFNGRSFTSTKSPGFDNCRAGGNTLVFAYHPGMKAEFYNSTLLGSGDVLVMSGQRSGCNGTERIISKNNIFLGGPQFGHPDITDLYYAAGSDGNGGGLCGKVQLDDDYSVIWATKNIKTACDGKAHSLCENPKFNEPPVQWYYGDAYDISLQSTSPAIGKGLVLTGKSGLDYLGNERGDVWDIGALEYGVAPTQPTCADGIQYCLTQTDCVNNGYYWYNNTCNAQPQPKTCADGIQYCTTQTACEGQNYFWYNNTCNAQPKPKTCADGIQYCTTAVGCEGQGYHWYNSTCNAQPRPEPQSQHIPQPKQEEILTEPTTPTTDVAVEPGPTQGPRPDDEKPSGKKEPSQETAGSNATETPDSGSVDIASTGEATTDISEESGIPTGKPSAEEKSVDKREFSDKGKPSNKDDSGSVSGKGPAASGGESKNAETGRSGSGGRGGDGKGGGGGGGGGVGGGGAPKAVPSQPQKSAAPTTSAQPVKKDSPNVTPQSVTVKGTTPVAAPRLAKETAATITPQPIKGEPPATVSPPAAAKKTDSALVTPSLHLTDNTSISLNRDDIPAQAEVTPEPAAEPDENTDLATTELETPLDKAVAWINDLWRKMFRWFSGD